ncbi:MAG TPA: hypothetical protein VD969_04060 [Symbiobacteriaceae bacterium]|nr:hypothetical protein [Symbiobacteriaceae bacterium]
MRTKLRLVLGAVLVTALGVSAGTVALFSAATANQDNTITAGTLAINSWRDQGDTIPGPMFYTTPAEGQTPGGTNGLLPTGLWAPGDTHHRVLMVRNEGSLDAWLVSVGADLHSGSMHLANKLQYKVTTDAAGLVVIASGTLGSLIGTDVAFPSKIALNAPAIPIPSRPPKPFHFWVTLPLDADNSYQGETVRVNFFINAEQKKNNP